MWRSARRGSIITGERVFSLNSSSVCLALRLSDDLWLSPGSRNLSPPDVQRAAFTAQVRLARDLQRPLFVHCREAAEDLVAILRDELDDAARARTLVHCFTGTAKEAAELVSAGVNIGITGGMGWEAKRCDAMMIDTCAWGAPAQAGSATSARGALRLWQRPCEAFRSTDWSSRRWVRHCVRGESGLDGCMTLLVCIRPGCTLPHAPQYQAWQGAPTS